jgi:glycosyltransferase involved in cell wall biosynthesis
MKKTVCLNMIVKDESKVIKRCLASVRPVIDTWVIIDTGSTDGTQEIIREFLQDIPGELHERPWVDFAHNRNEALGLAKEKADYLLIIDADQVLVFDEDGSIPPLEKDLYFICVQTENRMHYQREFLINNRLNWKWEGVLHEGLSNPGGKIQIETINDVKIIATPEGCRARDPERFHKDAAILEKALAKEPDNTRTVFYLAISYGNAEEYALALKYHQKRVEMGGDEREEIFYSLLSIGELQEQLNMDPEVFITSYSAAYQYRPMRIEPLYAMAVYFLKIKSYWLGYMISKFALTIRAPADRLFVRYPIYDYRMLFLFANSAGPIGKIDEALDALHELQSRDLPPDFREIVERTIQLNS